MPKGKARNVAMDVAIVKIDLPDAGATQALGRSLAQQLSAGSVLLLKGNLGKW